jgi:hypothetical protein
MMKQETIQAYTIDQHPNKEAVFDWIRNNWHDLGEFAVNDFIESLKALADAIDGKLDYSIGILPDRGEFIRITDYNQQKLDDLSGLDSLTGVCYDQWVILSMKDEEIELALSFLHDEGEYIYSDEGLEDLCEANQYYFTEDGAFHS